MTKDRRTLQDRLPPHSVEAEQAVLGAIMLDPQENLARALEVFPGELVFYELRHQRIYQAMVTLWGCNKPVDVIHVVEQLKAADQLEAVGGIAFLAGLPECTPSAANFDYHAAIVMELSQLRAMIRVLVESMALIYERKPETPVDKILDEVESNVLAVSTQTKTASAVHIKEPVKKVIEVLDSYARGKGMLMGLPTGFGYLDKMTGGLQAGEMFVLAGRPSTGKTSLAMNIAANLAKNSRDVVPVGVFSMEMSAEDIAFRMMCSEARADFHKIKTGFAIDRDFTQIARISPAVAASPIYIDDTAALPILQLRARARRMVVRYGIKAIVIDYLQLMNAGGRFENNRAAEVSVISNGIKALAKELKIPVVVLSQLNRDTEKEKHRKPQLSDLKESGSIEQDADAVGMLYVVREKDQDIGGFKDVSDDPIWKVNLFIAKQRNGPTGDCQLLFNRPSMRFEDRYDNRGAKCRELSQEDLVDLPD